MYKSCTIPQKKQKSESTALNCVVHEACKSLVPLRIAERTFLNNRPSDREREKEWEKRGKRAKALPSVATIHVNGTM